jgi:Ni/Co efflux regulator RcnB
MKTLIAAITSLSLFAGTVTPAFADHRDHDRHQWSRHEGRDHDRNRSDRHARRHQDERRTHWQRFDEHNYRAGYIDGRLDQRRFHAPRYVTPRGYHARSWHRGDRLPAAYCSDRYVVRDYHTYHLYAPPRGHHWVRVDNDVLLTAVATGAVVAVVGGLFH